MTRMRTVLAVCFAILLFVTGAAMAQSANEACSCTGAACGNGAVGGNQGDIFTGVSPANVKEYFTPNPNTGWTCVVPAKIHGTGGPLGCFCAKLCGNGGTGGDANFFNLTLTQAKVDATYGGGKAGNPTGWLCGKYQGTFSAAKAQVKK